MNTDTKGTLRGFTEKCRVLVRIDGKEEEATILFGPPEQNYRPVRDRVFLIPQGWFDTNDIELVDILPWAVY